MAVAGVVDDAVILRRRDLHVGRANRLDDYRADIPLLAEDVVDIFGAAQVAGAAAAKAALARIARRRMLGARQERSDVLAENRLAANGDRVQRRAVERVPERQRLMQKMLAVGDKQPACCGADFFRFPGESQRREVDVALGCDIARLRARVARRRQSFAHRDSLLAARRCSEYVLALLKLFIVSCAASL